MGDNVSGRCHRLRLRVLGEVLTRIFRPNIKAMGPAINLNKDLFKFPFGDEGESRRLLLLYLLLLPLLGLESQSVTGTQHLIRLVGWFVDTTFIAQLIRRSVGPSLH